jgi:diaminohydroxyphosphoribosylaminopyrimidine deaminase/5-amino-6-(5-phosphoribosylamino)uracil reductase
MNRRRSHVLMDRTSAALPAAAIARAFRAAISAANEFAGSTSPNPPVGCVVLDQQGEILACAAHERPGLAHAEAAAIDICRKAGVVDRIDTLVVTLEPCNHFGRTSPCSETILSTHARTIWIGVIDPNPHVTGAGAARLQAQGASVHFLERLEDPEAQQLLHAARRLIGPFAKWSLTGQPWITLKQALTVNGGMIPSPGRKTFTSADSLILAHSLRRRADAIVTGSGTVLADEPHFTVRHLKDHNGKRRYLAVFDRRGRVPPHYCDAARTRGFEVSLERDIVQALTRLGNLEAIEVLVEAGPTLLNEFLDRELWDEHVIIRQRAGSPDQDLVEILTRAELSPANYKRA